MTSKLLPLLASVWLLVTPFTANAATHLFTCSSPQFLVDTVRAYYTSGNMEYVVKAVDEGKCEPVPMDTVYMAEGAGYVKDVGQANIAGRDMIIYEATIPGKAPFYYVWKKTSA